MTTYMLVNKTNSFKQMTVNRLNFPRELKDIIRSYCFYDIKTADIIEFIQNQKKEIVTKIKLALYSRKNGYYFLQKFNLSYNNNNINDNINDNNEINDTIGHWVFYIGNDESQIQAINCIICGNYINHNNNFNLYKNIKCNCHSNILMIK